MKDDIDRPERDGSGSRGAPKGKLRYLLAVDSVDFKTVETNDPIILGRQVLEKRGLRPSEAFSLFNILPNGDFEDVRPDEELDLREDGIERLIAFSTDRVFRATLNGRVIAWGVASIPESALRHLAGIGPDESVFLEVRGGTDRLVPEGGHGDLDPNGTEAFITAPRPRAYFFVVNGKRYESAEPRLTGLQIKARVENWNPEHDLLLEGHGDDPDRVIADDEYVDLDALHGPVRLSPVPKANFG